MKMIMFDFRESEREYFNSNEFPDIDIKFKSHPLNEATVLSDQELEETDVISVFINSNVSCDVLKKFKNLRVVTTRSTGYNHIDVKHCSQNHIAVFNVEKYGQSAVAQYTITLILALVRNLIPAYLGMQKLLVDHSLYEGRNLETLTLGVIGGGAIGSAVAKLASALGMRVKLCSLEKDTEVSKYAEYVQFEDLLKTSDVITLHIPYTTENYHLISAKEIEMMKDGVYLVNTARGELIDDVALYENLLCGKIKGAALDVLECEFLSLNYDENIDIKSVNSKCMTSAFIARKLLAMENVIITPHIAYNTVESIELLLEATFNNIRDYAKGIHSNQIKL